ncbi:hypothetical protein TWF506_007518 [Arthrobotrys conoides]|uniref:Uncharacterized protein n=1 Tax=Arthrobotrys conoides TaxID=74498 RepID=A0AAN8RSW3_9PEZI
MDLGPGDQYIQASSQVKLAKESKTFKLQEPTPRLRKRAGGRPKKKGTAARPMVPQPQVTPATAQNSELLMYQRMAMQAYEEERQRAQIAAEQEKQRLALIAQEERQRAAQAARIKAEEELWKKQRAAIVENVLWEGQKSTLDQSHWEAVENRFWNQQPGLFDWDRGYNGNGLTLNSYNANDEIVISGKKRPSQKKLRWSTNLLNEDDQDDRAFIEQLSQLENEVPDEKFFAVEPYDLELPAPGTAFEQTVITFAPWDDVQEWHEYGVEKSMKPPIDADNSFDSNRMLSTASGRTSRNEMDSPEHVGSNRIRTPSQSLYLGASDSYGKEDRERMINEPTNPNVVTTSQLDESTISMKRPNPPNVSPASVRSGPPEEEEQKVNSGINSGSMQDSTDDFGYVSVRPGNENRIGKENTMNEMYSQWAASWKGPIYPQTERDWAVADFSNEWRRVVRSEYGLGACKSGVFDYHGNQRQTTYCRLKKSGLFVAPGLSADLAQKLDLFLVIGCRAVVLNVNCGTRHWYLQQKKVPTVTSDGSKAYQDIYIDVRFDLASASPADAGLGHGGVGLPHVQLSYMLPGELSSNQPPAEREWHYFEFRNAVKADQNILGNMFTDTKFPFYTAWPKEWVQADFLAPDSPWGLRKAGGNDVPIPALNKLIPIVGKQRVILTTRGWNNKVLDRSSVGKTAKIFTG